MNKEEADPLNPSYYTSYQAYVSCKDIARHMGYNAGTAFAYVWRAGKKESLVMDLDKAIWYLKDLDWNGHFMEMQVSETARAIYNLIQFAIGGSRGTVLRLIMNCAWKRAIAAIEEWKAVEAPQAENMSTDNVKGDVG